MIREEKFVVNEEFYAGRGRNSVTYNLHARNETDMEILEKTMESLGEAYDICVPAREPVNAYYHSKTERGPKGDVHNIWVFGKNITRITQRHNPNEINTPSEPRDKKDVRWGVSSRKPLTLCEFSPGYFASFNFGGTHIFVQHQYKDLGEYKEGLKNKKKK